MKFERVSILRIALIACCVLASFGFTSCKYFGTVTVPVSDATQPDTWGGVYDPSTDTHLTAGFNSNPTSYAVGYDQYVAAYASGNDSGGTKSITVHWVKDITCCYSNGRCQKSLGLTSQTTSDSQNGAPGSSVSSGIFLYKDFRPATLLSQSCGSLAPTSKIELRWTVTAMDFHGNTRTSATHRVSYGR